MSLDVTEWLAESLIKSVRRRAYMPANDASYSDDVILDIINEELRDYVVPVIRRVNEEHLIARYTFASVSGQDWYKLPPRCSGEAVKFVEVQQTADGDYIPLPRLEPEKALRIGWGYWLEDDRLYIQPTPQSALNYRLRYFYRPGRVVLSTRYATVLSVHTVTNRITVTGASAFVNDSGGSTPLDWVSGQPGFRLISGDIATQIEVSGAGIFDGIDSTLPLLAYGDFACFAGESPTPQVPVECWPLLAQQVAVKMLEGRGGSNYQMALDALDKQEGRTIDLLKPRTQAGSRYVHNFNSPGWRFRGRPRTYR